jgi:hypothetical protein
MLWPKFFKNAPLTKLIPSLIDTNSDQDGTELATEGAKAGKIFDHGLMAEKWRQKDGNSDKWTRVLTGCH